VGQLGLAGIAKICVLFPACNVAVTVPFTPSGATGFGIGGTQLVTDPVHTTYTGTAPPGVALTLQHATWTVGTPTMTIHTPMTATTTPVLPGGFAHGPASATSNTAVPSGVVQFVTVSKVFTSLTGAFPELPVFAVMNLHFAPEPGMLLLLAAGGVGVAVYGFIRRKKS
jgi:hypothetical protein